MTLSRIRQQFADHIEHTMVTAAPLPDTLLLAGQLLLSRLLDGGRVLVTGNGSGAHLAAHFSDLLLQGSGNERPPLPAMLVPVLNAELHLRALAQIGDLLVLIDAEAASEHLLQAARDRDVNVILICRDDATPELNSASDVLIAIPAGGSLLRWHEMALLVLHTLCDHTEQQLFGDLT